jgi:hypothetical protein
MMQFKKGDLQSAQQAGAGERISVFPNLAIDVATAGILKGAILSNLTPGGFLCLQVSADSPLDYLPASQPKSQ